jgi:hypothetical protein
VLVLSRFSRREVVIAALCYLALAMLVTIRLWHHPSSTEVAGNPNDADQSAWFVHYCATQLAHFRIPALITDALNAPQGIGLMWNPSIPFLGVVLAPLTLLAGPQVSLTVAMTCGFALSALALFCVLRSWGARTIGAAIAGFGYGFSPAVLHSAIGHYDLQFAVLPPLIVSAALRIVTLTYRRHPAVTGIWLGALVTAQLFVDEEVLLESAIAVLIAVLVLALSRPRLVPDHAWRAAPGIAVAIASVAVLASYGLLTQFFGRIHGSGNLYLTDFYKNDLAGFVQPSAMQLFRTQTSMAFASRFQGGQAEYLGYIGWPALIIMLVLAVIYWRVLAVRVSAVLYVLLSACSLGGTLLLNGRDHTWLKLPWYWVETKPLFGPAVVDRFSLVADAAAMALLAFGLFPPRQEGEETATAPSAVPWWQELREWGWAPLAVMLIAVLPLLPRPLPASQVESLPTGWQATFNALRLPANAKVLVVPVPTGDMTYTMRWQADTDEPVSLYGGYFIGPAWNGLLYIGGNGLPTPIADLNQLWMDPVDNGPVHGPKRTDLLDQLSSWQPAAIVAVTSPDSPLAHYLASVLGNPTVTTPTVLGWRR